MHLVIASSIWAIYLFWREVRKVTGYFSVATTFSFTVFILPVKILALFLFSQIQSLQREHCSTQDTQNF